MSSYTFDSVKILVTALENTLILVGIPLICTIILNNLKKIKLDKEQLVLFDGDTALLPVETHCIQ